MAWEQNLEDGLGLKRIKMGADEKDSGYLLQRKRALQIGGAILFILLVGYMALASSSLEMRAEQTKMLAAQRTVRAKEHAGLINVATMGAELEAHLLHEGHESFVEREFLNKEDAFESELLGRMESGLNVTFARFMQEAARDEHVQALGAEERAELTALLRQQNEELHSIVVDEITKFSGRMDALAKEHLAQVTAESESARKRLHELHAMLKRGIESEVASERRGGGAVATPGGGGGAPGGGEQAGGGDGAGGSEDAALARQLNHFFAAVRGYERAHTVELPAALYGQLRVLLSRARNGAGAREVERAVARLLEHSDAGEAGTDASGAGAGAKGGGAVGGTRWKHGARPFVAGAGAGEGIASYLEQLLFESAHNARGKGELRELQSRWRAGDVAGVKVLELLMERVQAGYPSDWLVKDGAGGNED
eukprot:g4405.t1